MKIAKSLALTILCTSLYVSSAMANTTSAPTQGPYGDCVKLQTTFLQLAQQTLNSCNKVAIAKGQKVGGAQGSVIMGKETLICSQAYQKSQQDAMRFYNNCVAAIISQAHGS